MTVGGYDQHAAMAPLLDALLAPPRCLGCGASGRPWCPDCAATVRGSPVRRSLGMPVLAVHRFDGPLRRAVIAWKEEGRAEARDLVRGWFGLALGPVLEAMPQSPVVPIPSSPAAERRRGALPLIDILMGVCPTRLRPDLLRAARQRADQAGLDRAGRTRNMQEAFRWCGGAGPAPIVVDDILTTGATMHAAAVTLRAAGVTEAVGFALAWRPARTLLLVGPAS